MQAQREAIVWNKEEMHEPHKHQEFLDALSHIKYGQLSLLTPSGIKYSFTGTEFGPNAYLKLYDWDVIDQLIARGEMGFAESYVNGRWSSENLADLLTFGLMNAEALAPFFYGKPLYVAATYLRQFFKINSLWGSKRNIMAHYDLGNDFYQLWLDAGMTYSGALFEGDPNRTLEEAQAAKYKRALSKLDAKPADHILDIGCGWGGFVETAAREGYRVTGITLSEEQAYYARNRILKAGLEHQANIDLQDYRALHASYDRIVSIGMFEHVGERYWPTYFKTIRDHLKPGGKALVQSIILDDEVFEKEHHHSGFMEQMIFPGGMLPSQTRFCAAANKAGLTCQEVFTFGKDYAMTAEHWLNRFHAQKEKVQALGYDESFMRLWRFYLSACIAAFKSGRTNLMQVQLTHANP